MPHETGFNAADNPYTESEFLKICEDYGVPRDPMRYRDEKFYWTYQHGIGWPDDYLALDSMTPWIIEKSQGFTDVGFLRISESVRAYGVLILSSQASARSSIVGNTTIALTAQSAFLNNFEDIVNRSVNIQEDIKRYQDTLSYASSKVDYSIGQNIYMLPSNMELKIKTGAVEHNNKILVSDGNFSLWKNDEVNLITPAIKNHKTTTFDTPAMKSTQRAARPNRNSNDVLSHAPAISQKNQEPKTITHNDEKIALVLALACGFAIWNIFQ